MGFIAREIYPNAESWDSFAKRVGASFRCAFAASRAWQIEHHLFHTLRRFEIVELTPDGQHKIGQCAVGVGRRLRVFADGLQLLPTYEERWLEAFEATLLQLGQGVYLYGSEWSLEPPRENKIFELEGAKVLDVYRTNVDCIEFKDWTSWESYYRSVSKNVRRNIAKTTMLSTSKPQITIGYLLVRC